MAEALGRLCHAASTTAKSSRSGSPRGNTHTGTLTGPHRAALSTAKASRSGSPGSSSSTDIATAKGSRPGSPRGSTHTGTPTGPHHAAAHAPAPVKDTQTAAVTASSSSSTHRRSRQHPASGTVMHNDGDDAQGRHDLSGDKGRAHAERQSQLALSVGSSGSQHAQVDLPVAAVGDNAQLSAEFTNQRSQRVLTSLHNDTAAEDEQMHSSAEGHDLQSSTEDEQLQGSAEGKQTQGFATGVEGGAAGGTAGILAALQRLDAQPDSPQLPADTQAMSSMHSGPVPIQKASNTQHESSSGSPGRPEAEQLSMHSSTQEPVGVTAVVTESEEQAESAGGDASGSSSAAPAGNAAIAPLLIPQVDQLCAVSSCSCSDHANHSSHHTSNNDSHNFT